MMRQKSSGESQGCNHVKVSGYEPKDREQLILFLKQADNTFNPPLSSPKRTKEGIEGYLKAMTEGGAKTLLAKREGEITGVMSYVPQQDGSIYWKFASVSNPRHGSMAFYMLTQQMVAQTGDAKRIWSTTWDGNDTMIKLFKNMGLENTRKIEGDYGGTRTTLVFESDLDVLRKRFMKRDKPAELPEIREIK